MDLRCHSCGAQISAPSAQPGSDVSCPACGALTHVVEHKPADRPGHPHTHDPTETRPSQQMLRRVFEPIPRPFVYAVGVALVLVILAPFWLYLLQDGMSRKRFEISEDIEPMPVHPPSATNGMMPMLDVSRETPSVFLDRFRGVRLDATRDEMQRRFNLRLQNTRGMVPEIYEASRVGDIVQITAHFYNNLLKEFSLVMREQRVGPAVVEMELRDQLGEPIERVDLLDAQPVRGVGIGIPGALGSVGESDELEKKLASFPHRRRLTWSDGEHRIEATIYYSSTDPVASVSKLTMHVSAFRWLETNRSMVGAGAPPPPGLVGNAREPIPQEQPKRLFP